MLKQIALAVATTAICCVAVQAHQPGYLRANCRAQCYNWHANYVYTPYGVPTALVVPPTANLQTNWSWGAPSTRISRIDHQFTRNYAGPGGGGNFRHHPYWPQDTAQFGVYHVRGPWYPTQP